MIRKLLNNIEKNRNSKKVLFRMLIICKDFGWFIYYNILKSIKQRLYAITTQNTLRQKLPKVERRKLKILYIFDRKDWAIHNVGKLWLTGIPFIQVTFKEFNNVSRKEFKDFDLIWYGYLELFLEKPYDLRRSIIILHDPSTLFFLTQGYYLLGKKEDFPINEKEQKKRLNILSKCKNIICISKELQSMLKNKSIQSTLIQTSGELKEIKQIKKHKLRICSVYKDYPRKNSKLMLSLQKYSKELGIQFDIKEGFSCLSEKKYTDFFDSHEAYVCTSFEEGGPLPAMNAMKRGLVVLTSPVGQIQEIIEDGKSGFICKSKEEFEEKIKFLHENSKALLEMRIKSRDAILKSRNLEDIRTDVAQFLKQFVMFPINEKKYEISKSTLDISKTFTKIYENNLWEAGSGVGSTNINTEKYRDFLEKFLKQYNIKSVVDAGCGDWQFSRLIDWRGIDYNGIDIVNSVIKKNKKKYERDNIKFFCYDILKNDLPKADLLILKDVLQHLSNKNVLRLIKKLKDYKYAIIVNDFCNFNLDIQDGLYRPINLNISPFNLKYQEVFRFMNKSVLLKK